MLIKFIVKNIFSFNEETEFNLFPNKTQRLLHHKINIKKIEILRLSAIYGANGSGKSNLIKSISLLETMIIDGKIIKDLDDIKFKLNPENKDLPISFGIEFYSQNIIYYYTLTFDREIILNEALYESLPKTDRLIFERNYINEKQKINFSKKYTSNEKNRLFVEILEEKLIQKNELLLSFLNAKYEKEFNEVSNAFNWFQKDLVIIRPEAKPSGIAEILDKNDKLKLFSVDLISNLNTGISNLFIKKEKFNDFIEDINKPQIKQLIEDIKTRKNNISLRNSETDEEMTLIYEENEIYVKRLITNHLNNFGNPIEFSLALESDGTKRLIDYLPAFNGIINENKVYIIDEIERSIHPITIKKILSKISTDEKAKGQLIFTTHESNLLDQDILRPDEIWFAQKDIDGASKLYSLSEFNIHNTANIENGYLNGRFGGIPFLSNLKDLNWNKYEVSE